MIVRRSFISDTSSGIQTDLSEVFHKTTLFCSVEVLEDAWAFWIFYISSIFGQTKVSDEIEGRVGMMHKRRNIGGPVYLPVISAHKLSSPLIFMHT